MSKDLNLEITATMEGYDDLLRNLDDTEPLIGSGDGDEARELYIQRMQEDGYEIVYPKANQLLIDLDSPEDFEKFRKQLKSLKKEFAGIQVFVKPSRNGLPGRHATVVMPFDMESEERIAWQAALGSDPFRELMSLFRIHRGDSHPTIFVENQIPF